LEVPVAIAVELVGAPNQKGRRSAARREMKLRIRRSSAAGNATDALIRNLSTTGMLLETATELAVGEKIVIDLPQMGKASAKIVWAGDDLFGCAFDSPLSDAAVSAAQLRSEPQSQSGEAPLRAFANINESRHNLGQHIRRIRLARGLSLVEFAQKMQVSRPTIWAWEAGKSSPRARKRQLLLKVLDVSESELEAFSGSSGTGGPSETSSHDAGDLKDVISQAKASVASVAGTTPDKVTLIIEI
jgi:transcriptional regulator with XRE-family HTH domain